MVLGQSGWEERLVIVHRETPFAKSGFPAPLTTAVWSSLYGRTSAERVTGVFGYLLEPALCLVVGVGLGVFYFGVLWLTVKKLPGSQCPGLLALGSYLGRLAVVLAGFYLVMDGHWERLFASVSGFFIVRAVGIRLARIPRKGLSAP